MPRKTASLSRLLIIVTRSPIPAQVKTRLIQEGIAPERAAELAAAFLTDTVAKARQIALRADVWLALDGDAAFLPPNARDLPLFPQRGNSLGERMVTILERGFASGYQTVCLIGSDIPHLPLCYIQEAFGRLEAGLESVFGPSDDGGYYLVGLRTLRRELFSEAIPWSVPETWAETVKTAHVAQIQTATIPRCYDLDTQADLRRLTIELQRGVADAPATAVYLLEQAKENESNRKI